MMRYYPLIFSIVCSAMTGMSASAKDDYHTSHGCEQVAQPDNKATVEHQPRGDVTYRAPEDAAEFESSMRDGKVQFDMESNLRDRLDPRKYNFPDGNETRFPIAGITMTRKGIIDVKPKMDAFTQSAAEGEHKKDGDCTQSKILD